MSDAAPAAKPDDSPPLHIWIGFIAMVVGQFMAARDSYGEWPSPKDGSPGSC